MVELSSTFALAAQRNADLLREADQERLRRLAKAVGKQGVTQLGLESPSALRRLLLLQVGRELRRPAWRFGRLG